MLKYDVYHVKASQLCQNTRWEDITNMTCPTTQHALPTHQNNNQENLKMSNHLTTSKMPSQK